MEREKGRRGERGRGGREIQGKKRDKERDKQGTERERNDRLDGKGEEMKRCSRLPVQDSWKDD